MMVQLSGKSTHLVQKCFFVQKTTNWQSCKFPKVKFLPKPKIPNSANTKRLNLELYRNRLALYVYDDWRNALKIHEISQNSSAKETGLSYGQKRYLLRQSWTKYLVQGKIGQDLKNVLSDFACFLTAIVKV